MRINPYLQGSSGIPAMRPARKSDAVPEGFADSLKTSIGQVNTLQHEADRAMQEGAVNGATRIDETMIKLEEADISLRMALKVRTKALEAYHEMMRMQF